MARSLDTLTLEQALETIQAAHLCLDEFVSKEEEREILRCLIKRLAAENNLDEEELTLAWTYPLRPRGSGK